VDRARLLAARAWYQEADSLLTNITAEFNVSRQLVMQPRRHIEQKLFACEQRLGPVGE